MNQTTVSEFSSTNGSIHALCLLDEQINNESFNAMSSSNAFYPLPDLYGVFISSVFFNCGVNPLMAIVGVFGNILTLAILRKEKKLTSIIYLQMTMTVCDLIFLICLLPFSFYLCGHSVYPKLIDKITDFFPSYMLAVLTRSLVMSGRVAVAFLAIDRTIAICFPFSKMITPKRTLAIIIVSNCVILGILVHDVILSWFGHLKILETDGYGTSSIFSVYEEGRIIQSQVNACYSAVSRTATKVVFEVVPVVTAIICNVMISRGLSTTLKSNLNTQNNKIQTRKERNAKVNKTLFLITCCFVLLCLPGDVLGLVIFVYTDMRSETLLILGYTTNSLMAANHAINFVIYGVSNIVYKKRYIEVLCCKRSSESADSLTYKVSFSKSNDYDQSMPK